MESNNKNNNRIEMRTNEPVSMENIPLAIGCILDDISQIQSKIDFLLQHLGMGAVGIKPVTLKEAAIFLSVSEAKLRRMVSDQTVPYYKRNGKLYFFEKELLEWVKESRVSTIEEELRNYHLKRKRR